MWTRHRAGSPGLILVLGPAPFCPWVSERKQGPSALKYFVQGSSLSLQEEEPRSLWGQASHGGSWSPKQRRSEPLRSSQQWGRCLRAAGWEHRSQPDCLPGAAGLRQRCPLLAGSHGGCPGAQLPGTVGLPPWPARGGLGPGVGGSGWTPALVLVPAAALALCLSSSAPTPCGLWPS